MCKVTEHVLSVTLRRARAFYKNINIKLKTKIIDKKPIQLVRPTYE